MIPHFYLFLFNSGLEDASIPYTALHVHFSVLLGYSTHLQSPSTLRRECFPHSSVGKEYACNAGDPGSILGLGRSSGGGIGYPLQYSGLENSMDNSPWGHKKSDTTDRFSLHFARAT